MEGGIEKLRVLVVGAGLAGLAAAIACAEAGHAVCVLEGAKELAEVGAGLQITPNASRLLYRWGLGNLIEEAGCEPRTLSVHRYEDGKLLAKEERFNEHMREKYGAPFVDIHRGKLHLMMHRRALDLGVCVVTSARVRFINFDTTTVLTEPGEDFTADLIVGADGLWSNCREKFLGQQDAPLPTGDLAYRIVLKADQLKDQDLKDMVSKPACRFWIGPRAHAVAYSIQGGTVYNIVLLVPDDLPPDVSRQAGSVDEMRELFKGWDPILTRFLNHVDSVDKWKLMHRPEVEKWTNDAGTFVLMGDSCHPMLPYLAQGANSAIEDGAVLGAVLENIRTTDQLASAVKRWERLRKHRSEAIVRETFLQRQDFHMIDGPEQIARDKLFAEQLGKTVTVKFPSRWTCPVVQPWLYGYNAYQEAADARSADGSDL